MRRPPPAGNVVYEALGRERGHMFCNKRRVCAALCKKNMHGAALPLPQRLDGMGVRFARVMIVSRHPYSLRLRWKSLENKIIPNSELFVALVLVSLL